MESLAASFAVLANPLVAGSFTYLILGYALLRWEQSKSGEADRQTGLKLILFFFLVIGIGIAAAGVRDIAHCALSLGDAGAAAFKQGMANVVTGALVMAIIYLSFLPRTNRLAAPRSERLALGYIAATAGFATITGFSTFLTTLITNESRLNITGALANALVYGALCVIALSRFGTLSGWAPPPPRTPTHPGPGPGGGPAGPGAGGYGGGSPGGYGGPNPNRMPPGYAPPGGAPPPGYPSGGGFPPPWGGPGPGGHKPGG